MRTLSLFLLFNGGALALPQFCNYKKPEGFNLLVVRGYGKGEDPSVARQRAQAQARKLLQDQVREARGAAVAREAALSLENQPGHYDPIRKEACAVAVLDLDRLGRRTAKARDALKTRLKELAQQVKPLLKHKGLKVEFPIWSQRSQIEALGRRLQPLLVGAFVGVKLGGKRSSKLLGLLSASGADCVLQPLLQGYKEESKQALSPIYFAPAALGLADCKPPPPSIVSDDNLGLEFGQRGGQGGLEIKLEVALRGEMVCPMDPLPILVESNQPAWLRLYSVADNGQTMLGWASEAPLRRWRIEDALAVRLRGQRYRLVAVGIPAVMGADGFGARAPGPPAAHCMAQGLAFGPQLFPPQASLSASRYGVWPLKKARCVRDRTQRKRHEQILSVLETLPGCP